MSAIATIKLGNKYYVYEEVKLLAEQLGMDLDQDREKYIEFLKGALNTLLPVGWKRERDPSGKLLYHNIQTSLTTETHPLIYHFRKAFLELVESNSAGPVPTPRRKVSPKMNETDSDPFNKVNKVKLWNIEAEQKMYEELSDKLRDTSERSDNSAIDQAIEEATQFYKKLLEGSLFKPPEAIENTLEYQLVDPEEMLSKFKEMNLPPRHELIWIARLALMLPLPPLWKYSFDTLSNKIYENIKLNVCTRIHPSNKFLTELIKIARFSREKPDVSHIMVFHDREYKRFEVDLKLMLAGKTYVVSRNELPSPTYYKEAKKARIKMDVTETLSDVMVLKIAADCGVELEKELHLVGLVFDFVENLKKHDLFKGWEFRYTNQLEVYWYNQQLKRSSKVFPFRDSLASHIKQARIQSLKRSKLRARPIADRHPDFKLATKDYIEKFRNESMNLLRNKIKKDMEEEFLDKIDLTELLASSNKLPIQQKQLYDLLFPCPFSFDKIEDQKSYGIYKKSARGTIETKKSEPKRRRTRQKLEIESDISLHSASSASMYEDNSIEIESDEEDAEEGQPVIRKMKPLYTELRNANRRVKSRYMDDVNKNSPNYRSRDYDSSPKRYRRKQTLPAQINESGSKEALSDSSIQSDFPKEVLNDTLMKIINDRMKLPRRAQKSSSQMSREALKIIIHGDSRRGSRSSISFTSVPSTKIRSLENRRRYISAAPRSYTGSHASSAFRHFEDFLQDSALTERNVQSLQGLRGSKKMINRKNSSTSEVSRSNILSATLPKEPFDYTLAIRAYDQRKTVQEADIETIHTTEDLDIKEPSHPATPDSPEDEQPRQPIVHYKSQSMISSEIKPMIMHKRVESLPKLPTPQVFKTDLQSPDVLNRWKVDEESLDVSQEIYRAPSESPIRTKSKRKRIETIERSNETPISITQIVTNAQAMVNSAKKNNRIAKIQLQRKSRHRNSSQQTLPIIDRQSSRNTSSNKNIRSREYSVLNSLKPSLHSIPYTSAYSFGRYEELLKDRQEKIYFMYYMSKLGHPYDRRFKYLNYILESFVLPSHIIYMAKRMDLKVSTKKYESLESDLLWIPYLQLAVPPPANSHIPKKIVDLVDMDPGTHPGDLYFHLLLNFHKVERMKELRELSDLDKARSMKESSWLPFKDLKGRLYYYNFMSGKQTYRKPFGILVREKSPIKSIESIKRVLSKAEVATVTQELEIKRELNKVSTLRIVAPRSVSVMKNISASGLKL
jgi:hypothetical protein